MHGGGGGGKEKAEEEEGVEHWWRGELNDDGSNRYEDGSILLSSFDVA